ncbi:MAG: PBP1A family penicillin-binding protein [Deltaproteobacteria bacterium]|nr:PBP1A family penicillin-binding protein [Deltaproteobacteria bacterium]
MNWIRSIFKTLSLFMFVCLLGVVLAFGIFMFGIFRGLPDVSMLKEYHHSHATEVFSDDGQKIGEFSTERRYPVDFRSIPKHVIGAFLAAEDAKFYEHHGVDYVGITRAVLSNLLRGRYAQGGSTITQQVARLIVLATKKKEITRKIREIILAWRMEKELTKDEILSLYLSEIYLGHGAYGIGAAARNYFHKKVDELSVAEGALLAGLPQRPNDWDPFHSPQMAKKRQLYVLKRMLEEKMITESERNLALAQPLRLYNLEDINGKFAPYFTEYVRAYLMKKYGSETVLSQGYRVETTVRVDLQKAAEKALDAGLGEVDKRLGWRGPIFHLDSAAKVSEFLQSTHEQILEEVNAVRVLLSTVDQSNRKLAYDLSAFERDSSYFGPTPISEGKKYKAVVNAVYDDRGVATAKVGQTTVSIPFSSLSWVKLDDKPARKISQVLKVGDGIDVKIGKLQRNASVAPAVLEQEPEIQGAVLSFEVQTGMVRAMVGGTDFSKSPFNRALHAKRQVGSTFKPIIYAAAIDKGFSPSSIVTDSPIVFKYEGSLDADSQGEDWRPHNYGNTFEGDIPLRVALIRSMNIPTVKILNAIGVDYGIGFARQMGITAPLPRELTIALGSWSSSLEELMRAYVVFPRLGKPVSLIFIRRVIDGQGKVIEELVPANVGPEGKIAESRPLPTVPPSGDHNLGEPNSGEPNPEDDQVVSPQTAYVVTDLLKGVIREGTGRAAAYVAAPVAGKTGTSNDHRDAWFVGFSPRIISGVWIGYDKDKPLDPGETGGRAAAPIWAQYMSAATKNYPSGDFPVPDDIVFAYVDRATGSLAAHQNKNRVRVAFRAGTVPNLGSSNLPRIGEPGAPRVTTQGSGVQSSEEQKPEEDTSDYLRQGYQN